MWRGHLHFWLALFRKTHEWQHDRAALLMLLDGSVRPRSIGAGGPACHRADDKLPVDGKKNKKINMEISCRSKLNNL